MFNQSIYFQSTVLFKKTNKFKIFHIITIKMYVNYTPEIFIKVDIDIRELNMSKTVMITINITFTTVE